MQSKKWWGFIKDPVFGYIHFTPEEKNVIDTKTFQRLIRIRQLAGAEYVYPGANHTRFEHSIGVMYIAGELAKNLECMSAEEINEIRLAGLLHDIGHGAFSHIFETVLHKFFKINHEDMTRKLIREGELKDIIKDAGYEPEKISRLAIGQLKEKNKEYLDQILRSTVDADKMDYIVRDSYHTGAGYSADVWRLIYTMEAVNNKLSVSSTAIYTLEAFLLARVESFKSIYFHKTARAAQIMIGKALVNAYEENPFFSPNNLDEYIELNDYTVWSILKNSKRAAKIIDDLEHRRLLKSVYENIVITKEKLASRIFSKEQVKTSIEREIAVEAGVSEDDVLIDSPLVPSVPYASSSKDERFEVPIFDKKTSNLLESGGETSKIIEAMKGYLNVLRVYTTAENREKVRKAALKILSSEPYELKIAT
ncbi:MAG: HD domain-containing protein [Candidatus Odinarchaeum yellowstonii]|uniref:HD domain-containing protein n=1 Tax=Odinarchaeota yellowstonii (strain LCB_4) TaxID=1841599 RepID=A0AAF0D434_ODILC|nr:MAG: HD domain-containing protein [Candidatus Odinarchaeum yellowstonii]